MRWLSVVRLALVMGAHAAAMPAAAQQWDPGSGSDALPSFGRLPTPSAGPPSFAVAGTAGYALIEPVEADDGEHHRLHGSVALAVAPVSWLGAYLRLDGRYDLHPDDALGPDRSGVAAPRVGVRLGGDVVEGVGLGLDASVWFPGSDAPSWVPEATSFEGRAVASYAPTAEAYQLAIAVGARLDQSAASVTDDAPLRRGDRISLGVGRTHAVLVGLAAAFRVDVVRLVGEIRWEPWVGDGAPALATSPLFATVGARAELTRGLWLEVGVEALLTDRPDDPTGLQVPVFPRVSAHAGLRGVIAFEGEAGAVEEEEPDTTETTPPEPSEETPDGPPPHVVSGRVLDAAGDPVVDARVHISTSDGTTLAETRTDDTGAYQLEVEGDGPWTLGVEAPGYEPAGRPITRRDAAPELRLEPAAPRGVLRGLIRNYEGDGLEARVEVTPGDVSLETAPDGSFDAALAPGDYHVEITAPGYRTQRRPVHIEEDGVTIFNVELRESRRRRRRR